jgi:N-acetylglucosaminyldiphosphoundecaprenol N-acetyl-beta-D-mannosaminyltransferase
LIKQTDLDSSDELNLVVTPYSEYFIKARKNEGFREVLNNAQLSLPDGIFVLWAASFNRMIIKSKNLVIRSIKAVCRLLFSGVAVVLYPKFTRRVAKERVSGSEIVYPLMEMAQKNRYKVFLLGGRDWGRGNAGSLAANKLQKKYPGLDIVGVYPGERKSETREEALKEINSKRPDLLLVCFGGGSGETWMYRNKDRLKAKVGIGLGGTFDFISGYAGKVPAFAGKLGLEWLLRPLSKERGGLISNLKRAYRVWRGMLFSSIILLIERINFKQRK